jgi:hypothetical protein
MHTALLRHQHAKPAIDADRLGFVTTPEGVAQAIAERARAEEGELHPAADRVAG